MQEMPDGLVWFVATSFWNSLRTLFVNYFSWYHFLTCWQLTICHQYRTRKHFFVTNSIVTDFDDIFPIYFVAYNIIVLNFIWFCIWLFDHLTNPIGHINFDCTGLSRLSELLKFSRSKSYTQHDWCQSYCPSVV